jgi:hypothetical protein
MLFFWDLSLINILSVTARAASSSSSKPTTSKEKAPTDDGGDKKAAKPSTGSADKKAQEEIKALKAELVKQQQKKRHASPEEIAPSTSRVVSREGLFSRYVIFAEAATAAPRPLKGASLANPNKKARKYQAIEFESDEE